MAPRCWYYEASWGCGLAVSAANRTNHVWISTGLLRFAALIPTPSSQPYDAPARLRHQTRGHRRCRSTVTVNLGLKTAVDMDMCDVLHSAS